MPESRYEYLYERLGDHDFQFLVAALLTARFPDFIPLPLRQADDGRDGVTRESNRFVVYQVKWSVHGEEKDPVTLLDKPVTGEADTITRLVRDDVRRYVLVTKVLSTGKALLRGRGCRSESRGPEASHVRGTRGFWMRSSAESWKWR